MLINAGDGDEQEKTLKGLRTIPPGFSRGLRLPGEEIEEEYLEQLDELPHSNSLQNDNIVSLLTTLVL